jgi:hypothetical protein
MQHGGGSQHGGTSQHGGQESLWSDIYRNLKALAPPGFWPRDDEKQPNKWLRSDSMVLAYALSVVRNLFNEVFPHTTTLYIQRWASYLGVVLTSDPTATWDDLRAPLISKWRSSPPPTLPNLRKMFYPLLLPTRARWDDFDDEFVSVRFDQSGLAGAITEAAGKLTIFVDIAQVGTWDGTTFDPSAPRLFERLPDMDDDFVFETVLDSLALDSDTAVGIYVEQDAKNAIQFVAVPGAPFPDVRVDQILEGTFTADIASSTSVNAAAIMKLAREGDEIVCTIQPADLSFPPFEVGRVPLRHKARRIGFFTRAGAGVSAQGNWRYYSLTMGKAENNVDIIEVPKAAADIAGSPEYVFQTWIRQLESESSGPVQFREAQRLADRVKHGHCLIGIIESENFLTDDPNSLTDRDVLGL